MKRFAVLVIALVLLAGCGSNPAPNTDPTRNLSPTGHAAYTTTKIVKALDVLRDVAAEGEKQNPKLISAASALKVIAYHRQVVETMGAVPNGWKAVAVTGLQQLAADLSANERAQLQPFLDLLKNLYDAFTPTSQLQAEPSRWARWRLETWIGAAVIGAGVVACATGGTCGDGLWR